MRNENVSRMAVGVYASIAVVLLIVVGLLVGGFGKNDAANWQIVQSITGSVEVKDNAGWYLRKFASVWTYPRAVSKEFKQAGQGEMISASDRQADQSVGVTFNDGGTADMGVTIRFATPKTSDNRRRLHAEFAGNINNVTAAVKSHLVNCAKATAPLMSSSEHMSARKAEFTQLVHDQLVHGLYRMRRVEKSFKDATDKTGDNITIFATEIVLGENGNPQYAQDSPLKQYDLEVLQFSIEDTDYDKKTLEKFAAKKDSLLRAEQAKAEREQEVQQRLMIVERGLREKAEVEAVALKEKARDIINGEREKEVAELAAAKGVAVAQQTKMEAETKASQQVEVARLYYEEEKLRTSAAEEQAKQITLLAIAEEERIKKAGAVTEEAQVLAEIAANRDVEVARELAKIAVPGIVISGGSNGNGGGVLENLIQMVLLRSAGVLPKEALNPAMANMRPPANE